MPNKSIVRFTICFGVINLLSAILATRVGDWFGLYTLLVSGPACGPLIQHMRPLALTGFSELQFRLACFVVGITFSGMCAFLPKKYMAAGAGAAWVILGVLVAGYKGVFS